MINKEIIYIGERPTKDFSVWGLPFHFVKGVPVSIQENIANAILERGKIFREVDASYKLKQILAKRDLITKKINILFIRSLGGLGDVLMNTPVFRAVKENIKNVSVTYSCLSNFVPLIQNNPYLDNYIVYDQKTLDSNPYDVVVDITRCCVKYEVAHKPIVDKHRTDIYLSTIEIEPKDKRPYYKVEPEEEIKAKQFIAGKKVIGFQIHSNAAIRDWDIPKYKVLAEMITSKWKDMHIILFDTDNRNCWAGDRIINVINYPIREVAAIMAQCKAFVSVDSGLMHLAGALKLPQVALFGNIDAQCRTKYYPETKVIQLRGAVHCVPCWRNECPSRECMKRITPEMVMAKLEELI